MVALLVVLTIISALVIDSIILNIRKRKEVLAVTPQLVFAQDGGTPLQNDDGGTPLLSDDGGTKFEDSDLRTPLHNDDSGEPLEDSNGEES